MTIPYELPPRIRRQWLALLTGHDDGNAFDPRMAADLPAPARRWLRHAITPGTPLRARVELDQHGTVRLGRWRPFTARQVLAPLEGYIWAERTRLFGCPVSGYDLLVDGTAQMRHALFGRVPLIQSSGPDLSRSAAGRSAAEIAFAPAAALDPAVRWKPVDDDTVTVLVPWTGGCHEVTLTVGPSGALSHITVPRWAKIGREPYREHLFTATLDGEAEFGGYTIPLRTTAGYDGTAFITQVIDTARYG